MFVTIDPFHTNSEYNIALSALENNKVDFFEYINIKPPYDWYLDVPSAPIMTNYEELTNAQKRYLVSKIIPARPNEEYKLQRREKDKGKTALEKFTLNTPLLEAKKSDFSCFFKVRSREQIEEITKVLPNTKIWYFGKYYNNKFKIALCNNEMIKNFIDAGDILVEKTSTVPEMEAELNYKVFKLNDLLKKYTETPYFKNGTYKPVKIKQFNQSI